MLQTVGEIYEQFAAGDITEATALFRIRRMYTSDHAAKVAWEDTKRQQEERQKGLDAYEASGDRYWMPSLKGET